MKREHEAHEINEKESQNKGKPAEVERNSGIRYLGFSKEQLILVLLVLASSLIIGFLLTGYSANAQREYSVNVQSNLEFAQFTKLSNAITDSCTYMGDKAAIYNYVDSQPNAAYFQGSCCSPMDWNHYQQQIAGLKDYSGITALPQNPYNVSVAQVKQLLDYYENITLNASQNATFNQAALLTDDKSWCCCQCWAWYAHAGMAKYLIEYQNFNVSQIVQVTNLEDCCGG